jgi:hypothetical protein
MPHLAPSASRAAAARRAAGGAAQRRAPRRTAATGNAASRVVAAASSSGSRLRRLGDSDLMVHEICLARAQRSAALGAYASILMRRGRVFARPLTLAVLSLRRAR